MTAPDPVVAQPALLARRNPLALPSLVLGVVGQLLGAAFSFGQTAVIAARTASSIQVIALIGAVQSVVVGLLGLAALVLGVVALVLRDRARRAVAAVGTAIGAVIVFNVLGTLVTTLLYQLAGR